MSFTRRRFPKWAPADDLPNIWLDATQTGTGSIKDSGGGSISDGENVGHWISQGSDAFDFIQRGAIPLPTFVAAGINGLPAILFNSQFLTKLTVTGWTSMTAMTSIVVWKRNNTDLPGGIVVGLTCSHDSGNADGCILQHYLSSGSEAVGGFGRQQSDSFSSIVGSAVAADQILFTSGVFDWTNAKLTLHHNGKVRSGPSAYGTAGSTSATAPFALSLGGYAGESVPGDIGFPCDAYIGEVLIWKNRAMTAAELVGPHAYVARKWNPASPAIW
jgi:hypothetical protein